MDLRRIWSAMFAMLAITLVIVAIRFSIRSDRFLLKAVEVETPNNRSPISSEQIANWAKVPVESVTLFSLDLTKIGERLLTHPWVRDVVLRKKFPETVAIIATMREPLAVIRETKQTSYLDETGTIFGKFRLADGFDLPVVTGVESEEIRQQAVDILRKWPERFSAHIELGALKWSLDRGFRLTATIVSGKKPFPVTIELGPGATQLDQKLEKLSRVFQEVKRRKIAVRQIFVANGQKIVVKTARHF